MIESGKKTFLSKKSYEIAYALFRIVPKIGDASIGQKLGESAANILASAVAENYGDTAKYLDVADYLLKLAMDLNSFGFVNGDILLREIGNLRMAIVEVLNEEGKAVDISELFPEEAASSRVPASTIFSHPQKTALENIRQRSETSSRSPTSTEPISVEDMFEATVPGNGGSEPQSQEVARTSGSTVVEIQEASTHSGNSSTTTFLKSGMRQIAILDKIRQSGNCRMRDIQEVLPDTSERTIRYDLEDLIERNLIERIGNGGPSVYYRVRQR